MSTDNHNKVLQTQVIAQWITSLAISVICCAILFIVFAGYIVKIQEMNNLLTVKIAYLEERYKTLSDEVARVHRAPQIVQIMARPSSPNGEVSVPVPVVPAPEAGGVPSQPSGSVLAPSGGEPKGVAPYPTPLDPVQHETSPPPTSVPFNAGEQTSVKTRPPLKFEGVHPAMMPVPTASISAPDAATGKGHPSVGIEEGIVMPEESGQVDLPVDKAPLPTKNRNFTTKTSPQ